MESEVRIYEAQNNNIMKGDMTMFIVEGDQRCSVLPALRKEHRYMIAAKVWFNWQTEEGRWREGVGTTRDISGNGLFVLADTVPVAGASIRFMVVMPALNLLPRPIAFHGYGKVVRIEPETGVVVGFAAAVTFDDTNKYWNGDEVRLDGGLFERWALRQDGWQPGNPTRSLASMI
jgi:hypothetical protein